MANHIHLYLTRASGRVFPFYNNTTPPTVGLLDRMSGEWRNEFVMPDLQTDLAVSYDFESTTLPQGISPIRGGYTLKEATTFAVENVGNWHTPTHKLKVLPSDLKICAPDSVLGKDLRQTTLSISHWLFTIKFGDSTMVVPTEVMDGDTISPAPPLGYEDENAPAVAT